MVTKGDSTINLLGFFLDIDSIVKLLKDFLFHDRR